MDSVCTLAGSSDALLVLRLVMAGCLIGAVGLAVAAQRSADDSWFFTLIAAVVIEVALICIGLLARQYDLLVFAVVSIGLEVITYQLAAHLERRRFATRT